MRDQGGKQGAHAAQRATDMATREGQYEPLTSLKEQQQALQQRTSHYWGPDYIAAFANGKRITVGEEPSTTVTSTSHKGYLMSSAAARPLEQARAEAYDVRAPGNYDRFSR